MSLTADFALMVEILGELGSRQFLTTIQPELRQYQHQMLVCLYQQDWAGAASFAHRFKATAHLYASDDFQEFLNVIQSSNSARMDERFLARLAICLQDIDLRITSFLKQVP